MLFRAMADCTPEDLLIGGQLWTCTLVGELIRMVAGVRMTEQGIGKWLCRPGYTPQCSDRSAYRQDQKKGPAWLEDEYPALAAQAREEKGVIAWAGRCGLRSDTTRILGVR
ncbi:winged helix-turn-helix domain-containing protein [[Kitasatospora] papulosa]|uniref:winged helix-turn-helix domain-containing protein n=1 Tax=[Kitasatospora] papulosa TaxID=1464011 RepID=UPI0036A51203